MRSDGGFEDEVHAEITVDPTGTIGIDPGEIRVKRGGYVSWSCADADEWIVDFREKGTGQGPFRDGGTVVIRGKMGERRGDNAGTAAHQGGKPDDPQRPDGPKGRYSYTIRVRVGGQEHERDPDLVVGPPPRE